MAKICLISLGCAKNLVDSEYLLGLLAKDKHLFVRSPQEADVVILNTCSFIGSARREAKNYINKLIKSKQERSFKLIVIGCLAQLEKENLLKQYPQIDAIFGISDYYKIPRILYGSQYLNVGYAENHQCHNTESKIVEISSPENFISNHKTPRVLSTPKSYAYLKIADGCNNRCAYCLIPTIRGPYRERPMEDILKEAEELVSCGIKELILVSHDTTFYGMKLYKKQMLHRLVAKLAKISGVFWIRILYTHPLHLYDELIEEVASNEKVCRYIDVPLQHTSSRILSLMGRRISRSDIYKLIEKLRKKVKNITIRTTVMVGFPTETDEDFKTLLDDIRQLEFDWLGCFIYSKEKLTLAEKLSPQVSAKIKKQRYNEIMGLQQKITLAKNQTRIGKVYPVLSDTENFGHTEFQCPEVDGRTYFLNQTNNVVGKVKIESVKDVYDLTAWIL